MNWHTVVDIKNADFKISYNDSMLIAGSCFAENIGSKLIALKFSADLNPCGILYNPFSLSAMLKRVEEGRLYRADELLEREGKWISLAHHGNFKGRNREEVLERMNTRLVNARRMLSGAGFIILTFGTSWVYRYRKTGEVVANCHKLPSGEFERFRLSPEEIVSEYTDLISGVRALNPDLKWIFTVSPVRHWKDGAHGNRLSKSVLLLAIDMLTERFRNLYYFPSYEIMEDELRDYRFYARDMIHPSEVAVDYIWERFKSVYMDEQTTDVMKRVEKINANMGHRPFDTEAESYEDFIRNTLKSIERLEKEYPHMDFSEERIKINRIYENNNL